MILQWYESTCWRILVNLLLHALDENSDPHWRKLTLSLLLVAQRLKWATKPITKIKGYHRNYMLMLIIVPHCSRTLKAISRGSCRFVNAAFACWNCKGSEAKTKIISDECEIACSWLNLSWTWIEQLPESAGNVSDLTSNGGIRRILY